MAFTRSWVRSPYPPPARHLAFRGTESRLACRIGLIDPMNMFVCIVAAIAYCATAPTAAAQSADHVVWSVQPGEPGSDESLGFGWGDPERHTPPSFRWIHHLEGDVRADIDVVDEYEFNLHAGVAHLSWRRQRIALYVNHRYVTEWMAPDDHHVHDYTTVIPARYFNEGENKITLRAAYRTALGGSRREYAVAVHSIELRSR